MRGGGMRGMHANEEREEDTLTCTSHRVSIQVSVVWVAACLPVLPDAPFTFTAHVRAASHQPPHQHAPAKKMHTHTITGVRA